MLYKKDNLKNEKRKKKKIRNKYTYICNIYMYKYINLLGRIYY